jgi:hypothetical protein
MPFKKYIAQNGNIAIKGNFAKTGRAERSRADDGYILRNSVYADIEKTAYTCSDDKADSNGAGKAFIYNYTGRHIFGFGISLNDKINSA